MVSSTASAPSLPRASLCRHSSAIRTGCANERSSGSEEGVASNRDPYSDLIDHLEPPSRRRRGSKISEKLSVLRGWSLYLEYCKIEDQEWPL
jgi:hypothetical protein